MKEKHNELEKELIYKVDELNKVSKENEDLSKYIYLKSKKEQKVYLEQLKEVRQLKLFQKRII